MTLTQKTTVAAEYLARLIGQFQGKPNIAALLQALLDQVQDLENAAFEVLTETTLAVAVGEQLDGLGQIVGETRQGDGDADYRSRILSRIDVNTGGGTAEDLIAIYEELKANGAGVAVITSDFPAGFVFEMTAGNEANGELIASFLLAAKAEGVQANIQWQTAGPIFLFDTGGGQGFDAGLMIHAKSG